MELPRRLIPTSVSSWISERQLLKAALVARLFCRRGLVAFVLDDPHTLDVDELADAELAQLTAEAGVLDAAKWQTRIGCDHAIDEEQPRFYFGDELSALGAVASPR